MSISKREVVSVLCSLMVASSAYADDGTSSAPFGIGSRSAMKGEKDVHVKIGDSVQKQNAQVGSFSFPGMKSVDWNAAGKKVASVEISGGKYVPVGMFASELMAKPQNVLGKGDIVSDLQMIYMSGFYKDVRFRYETNPDGSLRVIYEVVENPVIKAVEVYGTALFDSRQLAVSLGSPQGQILNIKSLGEKLTEITNTVRKSGYPLFTLTNMEVNDDGILRLSFMDGIVDGFEIHGSKRVKPNIVLREMRQKVGEPLNTNALQYSGRRLYNLGIFDLVDFQLVPSDQDPSHVKVVIIVEEGNNAVIGVGVGYGEIDGTTGQFTIGDKNFLGTGDNIQFKYEIGGETRRNYDFTYQKPYIDKKGTSVTLYLYDGIHETADYDHWGSETARYRKRALGQEITFSRADTDVTRNYITIKNRKDGYDGPVSGYNKQYFEDSYNYEFYKRYGYKTTAEERRKDNFGTTRSITISRVFDNRDSIDFPTRGKRNEYSFEVAGFGGDFNFQKLYFDHRYYWPCGPHGAHTLAFEVAGGHAWGNMPLSQRFAVGGSTTLRGYENGQFRGNSMLRSTVEYRIPFSKKASVLAFVDTGYAWDTKLEKERNFDLTKLKCGFGIGFRLKTPIGPVRLDYGFGKRDGDSSRYKGRFHFSFGGTF